MNIPLIVMGTANCKKLKPGHKDYRLAGLRDIMPTLLELAEIECPKSCTGISLIDTIKRKSIYSEALDGPMAMRMVFDGTWKLIWYPAGNKIQLFNKVADPQERHNLAHHSDNNEILTRLTEVLINELYGQDLDWIKGDQLLGFEAPDLKIAHDRSLFGQRGIHYPEPPIDNPNKIVGAP